MHTATVVNRQAVKSRLHQFSLIEEIEELSFLGQELEAEYFKLLKEYEHILTPAQKQDLKTAFLTSGVAVALTLLLSLNQPRSIERSMTIQLNAQQPSITYNIDSKQRSSKVQGNSATGFNSGSTASSTAVQLNDLDELFKTPDSLGARVIGAAEGNYGIDGKRNKAYYGHSDPGNAVWNQGFCSDQGRGGGNTDGADQACLKYARQKLHQVKQDFAKVGLVPNQEEALNLMDLFNQAHPDISARFPGELKKAKGKGDQGRNAIANARTNSFYIEGKNTAGGLLRACRNSGFTGSDWDCVRRDQWRRVERIGEVLDFFNKQAATESTPAKGEMVAGYPVTSPWGPRRQPIPGASTFHRGTDVGMPEGTPVYVVGTGQNFKCSWDDKGGNVASFDSPEVGASFDYLHLSKCDQKTREMRVGNTGLNGGPHLHVTQRDPKTLKKVPALKRFVEWAIKGKKQS